jgi:3-mercaptopyruvate sulfurtransferase SseA
MLARLARLFSRPSTAPIWVEAAELQRWLAGEGAPVIVDVRGPDEFAGPLGHIDGARNIPLAEVSTHTHELAAEGRPLVMVCLTDSAPRKPPPTSPRPGCAMSRCCAAA